MTTSDQLASATRMGARAGSAFHDTGVPVRNPFVGDAVADLAAAWRKAYFANIDPEIIEPAKEPKS